MYESWHDTIYDAVRCSCITEKISNEKILDYIVAKVAEVYWIQLHMIKLSVVFSSPVTLVSSTYKADCHDIYRIMAVMKIETDSMASIALSLMGKLWC